MNIEWLLNKAKQKFYPITNAKAVLVGENNETLDTELDGIKNDLAKLFSSNITGIKLNGSTLEVSFNNGTSVGKVSFEGIVEEETIIS